jgi:hypothetical protein
VSEADVKGGLIVAETPALFEDVRDILVADLGAHATGDTATGYVQIIDEGRTLLIYTVPPDSYDVRGGPYVAVSPGDEPMSQGAIFGLGLECRDEDLVASTLAFVGSQLPYACWSLDGDGYLWPAAGLDPSRIRL